MSLAVGPEANKSTGPCRSATWVWGQRLAPAAALGGRAQAGTPGGGGPGTAPPPARLFCSQALFGGAQGVRRRAHGGGQLPGINLLPGARIVAGEVTTAGAAIDLRLLGSRRRDRLITQG